MKLKQADSLLNNGLAMSSKFKTASKFILQPVTIPEISQHLLSIYLTVLRPIAASKNKIIIPQIEEPLWISFYDGCAVDVGRLVQSYFKRRLGINISTTNIRSLVETETETMFRMGKISQDERTSISFINGHSSQTTKDYYVREDIKRNISQAKNVFDNISNNDDEEEAFRTTELIDFTPTSCEISNEENDYQQQPQFEDQLEISTFTPPAITNCKSLICSRSTAISASTNSFSKPANTTAYAARVWGAQHPEFGKKEGVGERAQWSPEEKRYLIPLAESLSLITKTNLMARCLKHIQNDPSATPIFHKRHILTTDRLKSYWVAYQKKKKELELDE
jgi:hypothetical protein